ncbi:hypothetical protein GCM10010439_61780 [Actinocorallia aurantiaca]|jgi:putative heme iron utilization protein|uniref:DUF2470 domain-containing protein n=2 Tax=Actinocorallia aurantiaca TaxID=46204 RepID=A0ABN3UMT4_9ACTN
MSQMSGLPFGPEVVAAITAHMNGDHAEDNALICRGLGGVEAVSAVNTGLDAEAMVFEAVLADGAEREVRVPFSEPIKDRVQVRHEVVRMYQEACAALGVTPRGH